MTPDDPMREPIAFREIALTVEEALEIEKILDDTSEPGHAGKEMPTLSCVDDRRMA